MRQVSTAVLQTQPLSYQPKRANNQLSICKDSFQSNHLHCVSLVVNILSFSNYKPIRLLHHPNQNRRAHFHGSIPFLKPQDSEAKWLASDIDAMFSAVVNRFFWALPQGGRETHSSKDLPKQSLHFVMHD